MHLPGLGIISQTIFSLHTPAENHSHTKVSYGVPQGSVPGSSHFYLYMLPLGTLIRRHGMIFHWYSNDTQLELRNLEKIEVVIVGLKHLRSTLSSQLLTLDGSLILSKYREANSCICHFKIRQLKWSWCSKKLKSLQLIQIASKYEYMFPVLPSAYWPPVEILLQIYRALVPIWGMIPQNPFNCLKMF